MREEAERDLRALDKENNVAEVMSLFIESIHVSLIFVYIQILYNNKNLLQTQSASSIRVKGLSAVTLRQHKYKIKARKYKKHLHLGNYFYYLVILCCLGYLSK